MKSAARQISQERLKTLFEYRDGCLWRSFRSGPRPVLPRDGGKDWYRSVKIDGNTYLVHRVVWTLLKGAIPSGMEVDHIDGDKTNNRIENLRLASRSDNGMNRLKPAANTSGFKGVLWSKAAGKWLAKIKKDQTAIHIGLFDDADAARRAYEQKARELFGQFSEARMSPVDNSNNGENY